MIANGVILAENDSLMRSVIRSILLRAELQVFPVANGMEAVAMARQFVARLVLLDVAMPMLNGLLACQAIRSLPGYAATPIMMLTGYDDDRIRGAALRLGASDFITKPFRPDVLLARLARHVDLPAGLLQAAGDGAEDRGASPRGHVWERPAEPERPIRPVAAPSGAQIWESPPTAAPRGLEPSPLIEGRETIRIVRGVDRPG
jgi:CheY-like chemotaxis protein